MQPELLANDNDTIQGFVTAELRSIFGMKADPMFSEVITYNNAMPQYYVGHLDRVAAIESLLRKHAGLHLAGSAYHGVGFQTASPVVRQRQIGLLPRRTAFSGLSGLITTSMQTWRCPVRGVRKGLFQSRAKLRFRTA
jgi:hypothetical protein